MPSIPDESDNPQQPDQEPNGPQSVSENEAPSFDDDAESDEDYDDEAYDDDESGTDPCAQVKAYVEAHPLKALAAAFLSGVLVSRLLW